MHVDGVAVGPRRRCLTVVRMLAGLLALGLAGCGRVIPLATTFRGDAGIVADATLRGTMDLKLPSAVDPGEIAATVVRPGKGQGSHRRIALVDVDGVLLNQNYGSLCAIGDNPLAAWRDKLDAAAR